MDGFHLLIVEEEPLLVALDEADVVSCKSAVFSVLRSLMHGDHIAGMWQLSLCNL